MSATVQLSVNGRQHALTPADGEPLLHTLRNVLDLKASRFGCGLEQCGACMVLVDGAPRKSCTLPTAELDRTEILSVEGLADDPVGRALIAAFQAENAGQCGYCIPGILISAHACLSRTCLSRACLSASNRPTRAEMIAALDGHLCRCGAHLAIIRAVERVAMELFP